MSSPGSRRDLLWGLAFALVVGTIAVVGTAHVDWHESQRPVDAVAIVCAVVGAGALVLWKRSGIVMLVLVGAAMFTYLALDYPRGPALLAGPVALLLAAATQNRAVAWSAAVGVAIVTVVGSLVGQGSIGTVAVAGLGWPFAAVLAGQLISARRQQAESDRAREELRRERVREAERLRLAQDLHDSVAHAMATINVQSGVAAHLLNRDAAHLDAQRIHATLEAIRVASGEALDELGSILAVMRRDDDASAEAERRPTGDLVRLDDLIERARADGIHLELCRDDIVIPPRIGEAAYRVIQEALANTLRHAGPGSHATVSVVHDGEDVVVSVVDDGGGTPTVPAHGGTGLGLVGMRERVEATGGTLVAEPRRGRGFQVVARWRAT